MPVGDGGAGHAHGKRACMSFVSWLFSLSLAGRRLRGGQGRVSAEYSAVF